MNVIVFVWLLMLSIGVVYGLIRLSEFIDGVSRDLKYLNDAVPALDMYTKSLNTQMHHANVRIQVLVEKNNELECHQNQLKKNMLVMHENNQMLHDQMTIVYEQMNVLNDKMKTVYDQMVDLKRLSINDSRVD